jgi:predicted nucleic acid-binding protein
MELVVVYDACALHPAPLRDLLIRIAQTELVRARWSDRILDEVFASVQRMRPALSPASLERTRQLMNRAIPDVVVEGFEELERGLTLPDADDRHVLAAAIHTGAQAIVTFNEKDFPSTTLAQYGLEAVHPDTFVVDLIDLAPGAIARIVDEQTKALKNPPCTIAEVLDALAANGLNRSAVKLRELFGQ